MKNTLLIFIRNPQLGKVKTRLARTLGDVEALRIYHILLEKTRTLALECEAERVLFYSDFVNEQDDWPAAFFQKEVQQKGDLGQRMESAFKLAFDSGTHKALIIGSDCPELNGAILQHAFDLLDSTDFVLGPVPDGGYYMLGMKDLEPTVFNNIAWSTESVRSKTIEKIQASGKTFALLPMLSDVDTEEDWRGLIFG
ncbi:MAG: TIGR04282 family arsenosugar biosynthesis glycosyltransferase [Saprospiraceae bacterium]|nr:TIGR04282 family arsenosugar biosynthesis glycosyltransferase [Saprospiraceae bacterium]